MNKVDKFDLDPLVYLEVEGVIIPQVVVYFDSQVNIFPKRTWLKLAQPHLTKPDFYIKLAYQGFVQYLGIWKDVMTTIMGISTRIEFEVI
jgi:hypothetical protein